MRGISCYLMATLVVIDPSASISGAVPRLERDSLIRGGRRAPGTGWRDERKGYSSTVPNKRKERSSKYVSDSRVNWGKGKQWNRRDDMNEEYDDDDDDWVERKDGEDEYDSEEEEEEDGVEDHDYGMYNYAQPMGVKEKLSIATGSVGNRVLGAKHKAEKLYREAHTFLSSDLESVLLKATRPDNDPASPKYCESVIEACSRNFPSYMTVPPKAVKSLPYEETPYEQLLRKLARMVAEKDWRTTTKALYLAHLLSTEISDASWAYLRKTYLSLKSASCLGMSRKGNSHHSASDKTLFSRQSVTSLSPSAECYAPVLDAYSQFVRARLYSLSPSLSELSLGRANLASITQAERLIRMALACSLLLDARFDNDIMLDCLQLCLRDLVMIWNAHEELVSDAIKDSPERIRDTQAQLQCCSFHVSNFNLVRQFVRKSNRHIAQYGDKPTCDLKSRVKLANVQSKIEELSQHQ